MKLLQKIRAIFNFKGRKAEMELKAAEVRGNKVFLHPADDPDHTFCVSGKAIDILIDPSVALTEDDFTVLSNVKLDKLQSAMEIDPQTAIAQLLQPKAEDPQEEKEQGKTNDVKAADVSGKMPPTKEASHNDKSSNENGSTATKTNRKDKAPEAANEAATEVSVVRKPNVPYTQFMPKMRTVSMRLYPEEYEMLMEYLEENDYKKTEYLLACVKMGANKKGVQTAYQKYYVEHQQRRKADREAAKAMAEQEQNQTHQVHLDAG